MTKFDDNGINVCLQVEPGKNDLVELAKIVLKQYGHHKCLQGFGIDLEWWKNNEKEEGSGTKLTDSDAKKVVDYARSELWSSKIRSLLFEVHKIFSKIVRKFSKFEDFCKHPYLQLY